MYPQDPLASYGKPFNLNCSLSAILNYISSKTKFYFNGTQVPFIDYEIVSATMVKFRNLSDVVFTEFRNKISEIAPFNCTVNESK